MQTQLTGSEAVGVMINMWSKLRCVDEGAG